MQAVLVASAALSVEKYAVPVEINVDLDQVDMYHKEQQ